MTKEILIEASNIYVDSNRTILLIDVSQNDPYMDSRNLVLFIYDNNRTMKCALPIGQGILDSISGGQIWVEDIVDKEEEDEELSCNDTFHKVLIKKRYEIQRMNQYGNRLVQKMEISPDLKNAIIYSKRSSNNLEVFGWSEERDGTAMFSIDDTVQYPLMKLRFDRFDYHIGIFDIYDRYTVLEIFALDKDLKCLSSFYTELWEEITRKQQGD